MRKLVAITALAAALASPSFAADPLEGFWRTAADDNGNSGLIEVVPCAAALCGTLIKAFGPAGTEIPSKNIGRELIWDTVAKGNGLYRGKVYSPDRDKTYNSKLTLNGTTLTVFGCVLGICREGGLWTKQ